jgi:hypothetical protein
MGQSHGGNKEARRSKAAVIWRCVRSGLYVINGLGFGKMAAPLARTLALAQEARPVGWSASWSSLARSILCLVGPGNGPKVHHPR